MKFSSILQIKLYYLYYSTNKICIFNQLSISPVTTMTGLLNYPWMLVNIKFNMVQMTSRYIPLIFLARACNPRRNILLLYGRTSFLCMYMHMYNCGLLCRFITYDLRSCFLYLRIFEPAFLNTIPP